MSQIFNTILKVKKFLVQWVTEFIHTLREKKNRPKRSTKSDKGAKCIKNRQRATFQPMLSSVLMRQKKQHHTYIDTIANCWQLILINEV